MYTKREVYAIPSFFSVHGNRNSNKQNSSKQMMDFVHVRLLPEGSLFLCLHLYLNLTLDPNSKITFWVKMPHVCSLKMWNCMFSGRAVNFDVLITITIILFGRVWF